MDKDANRESLIELANTKMPFGKYAGRYLIDLPEAYVLWFKEKGYPKGKLGILMASLYEIKLNGLEKIIRPQSSLDNFSPNEYNLQIPPFHIHLDDFEFHLLKDYRF